MGTSAQSVSSHGDSTKSAKVAECNVEIVLLTQILDGGLEKAGVPYSYGFSIILLTILVKAATFPLSKKQVWCCHRCSSA